MKPVLFNPYIVKKKPSVALGPEVQMQQHTCVLECQ